MLNISQRQMSSANYLRWGWFNTLCEYFVVSCLKLLLSMPTGHGRDFFLFFLNSLTKTMDWKSIITDLRLYNQWSINELNHCVVSKHIEAKWSCLLRHGGKNAYNVAYCLRFKCIRSFIFPYMFCKLGDTFYNFFISLKARD